MPVNKEILRFFTEYHKPAAIVLIGTNDLVGIAIRNEQRSITADGNPSILIALFSIGVIAVR